MNVCAGCEVERKLLPEIEADLVKARERERWDWVDRAIERIREEVRRDTTRHA